MAFFDSLVIEAKTFQFSVCSFGIVTLTEQNIKSQFYLLWKIWGGLVGEPFWKACGVHGFQGFFGEI